MSHSGRLPSKKYRALPWCLNTAANVTNSRNRYREEPWIKHHPEGKNVRRTLHTKINRKKKNSEKATSPNKQKRKEKKERKKKKERNMVVVIIHCYILGYKDRATTWYLNGLPGGSNLGSTV